MHESVALVQQIVERSRDAVSSAELLEVRNRSDEINWAGLVGVIGSHHW